VSKTIYDFHLFSFVVYILILASVMGDSLPENRITPTELPTEIFHRQFLPPEIIPSQILSVLANEKTPSAMPPVYTDGIILSVYTGGEKFFLKIATAR